MNEHAKKRPSSGKLRRIIKTGIASLLVCTICLILFLIFYLLGIEEWKEFDPSSILDDMELSLLLEDASGKEYACLASKEKRRYCPLNQISDQTKNAFLAMEDARFYEHNGIDLVRIGGALLADMKSGSIKEGASTISQQLIKNTTLTSDQNMARKLAEMMMAFKLERAYSKDEILEMYLNTAYFGGGAYGIETAAMRYFGKSAADLSLAEAALLAGVLKSPSNYAPHRYPEKSKARRNLVLQQMYANAMISKKEMDAAQHQPIVLAEETGKAYPYGFYTDAVLTEACQKLHVSYQELFTGGYKIKTALDPVLQEHLEILTENPANLPPAAKDGVAPQCAAVVLHPKTGLVSALQGGRKHETRLGFNRAISMRRQPGSTIKPILVYAPALEYAGYSTTSFLLDQPQDFDGYAPRNIGQKYRGWITLRDCVAFSINVPAVSLLKEIGVSTGMGYASSVGIPFEASDRNHLSLALGGFTTGVTPLELCASYMPFANGGFYQSPSCIRAIYDQKGNLLYENKNAAYSVLSPETAYLMTSMLQSTVAYGTAQSLQNSRISLAAKTGTSKYQNSSRNKDIWIVAYNPEMITCVWMGFDQTDETHSLENSMGGNGLPAAIALSLFEKKYPREIAPVFQVPEGIAQATIDASVLNQYYLVRLATEETPKSARKKEYFLKTAVPKEFAFYLSPQAPDDFLVTPGKNGAPLLQFTSEVDLQYALSRKDVATAETRQLTILSGTGKKMQYEDVSALAGRSYLYSIEPILPVAAMQQENSSKTSATYLYSP